MIIFRANSSNKKVSSDNHRSAIFFGMFNTPLRVNTTHAPELNHVNVFQLSRT